MPTLNLLDSHSCRPGLSLNSAQLLLSRHASSTNIRRSTHAVATSLTLADLVEKHVDLGREHLTGMDGPPSCRCM
jgi:hypothetical protein